MHVDIIMFNCTDIRHWRRYLIAAWATEAVSVQVSVQAYYILLLSSGLIGYYVRCATHDDNQG